MQRKILA